MILKMQIVRKGTPYESYRVSIPKGMVEHYNLKDVKFKIEYVKGRLIFTPIKQIKKKSKKK